MIFPNLAEEDDVREELPDGHPLKRIVENEIISDEKTVKIAHDAYKQGMEDLIMEFSKDYKSPIFNDLIKDLKSKMNKVMLEFK